MTNESQLKDNQIFWIDVNTIFPNPYQPRKDFDEASLRDLADSIRQYGILQPLTVTEAGKMDDGSGDHKYELIAGERRLRAAKLAGLKSAPVVIRIGDDNKSRLELAIIENLQREDLNPIDRAKAFMQLAEEFGMTHSQIGKKMGKSREYVSNTLRLLSLPQDIKDALAARKIAEGHTRPLMMLADRPDEQNVLFKEIVYKKMSVRESEKIARKIAHEKVRKAKHKQDPTIRNMEQQFSDTLGTRVQIEKGEVGGKIVIDYFSQDDLGDLLEMIQKMQGGAINGDTNPNALLERFEKNQVDSNIASGPGPSSSSEVNQTKTSSNQNVYSDTLQPLGSSDLSVNGNKEMSSAEGQPKASDNMSERYTDSLSNSPETSVGDQTTSGAIMNDPSNNDTSLESGTPKSTVLFHDADEVIDGVDVEHSDVDDVELDIVANPDRDVPKEYYSVFKFDNTEIQTAPQQDDQVAKSSGTTSDTPYFIV